LLHRGERFLNPKIAFFDIETAPTRAYVWENYDTNVIRTDRDWYMLSFAVKWSHKKSVQTVALPDFPGYQRNRECDKALSKALWEVFHEADILVAHNGDRFDIKKANARFLVHGFRPPSTYKTVDTLKVARRHFKFNSNRLDDLGRYLRVGSKLPHTGAHLWFGCMSGDEKSWRIMRKYNAQDVKLLEQVYYKMRAWAPTHPNLTLYKAKPVNPACPTCQSTNVQKRGVMVKLQSRRERFHCQGCGSWFAGKPV